LTVVAKKSSEQMIQRKFDVFLLSDIFTSFLCDYTIITDAEGGIHYRVEW